MEKRVIDARGLQCPQPQLKMLRESHSMAKGDILECISDCVTFEEDVRGWVERTKRTLLWFRAEGTAKRCQVRL
jgi:TusA-related sulfurtransferase